jgi:hypothetical protein
MFRNKNQPAEVEIGGIATQRGSCGCARSRQVAALAVARSLCFLYTVANLFLSSYIELLAYHFTPLYPEI